MKLYKATLEGDEGLWIIQAQDDAEALAKFLNELAGLGYEGEGIPEGAEVTEIDMSGGIGCIL